MFDMRNALFAALVAKKQGLEMSEAFKIGLLNSFGVAPNNFMPIINSKLQAEDKVRIKELEAELEAERAGN